MSDDANLLTARRFVCVRPGPKRIEVGDHWYWLYSRSSRDVEHRKGWTLLLLFFSIMILILSRVVDHTSFLHIGTQKPKTTKKQNNHCELQQTPDVSQQPCSVVITHVVLLCYCAVLFLMIWNANSSWSCFQVAGSARVALISSPFCNARFACVLKDQNCTSWLQSHNNQGSMLLDVEVLDIMWRKLWAGHHVTVYRTDISYYFFFSRCRLTQATVKRNHALTQFL